MKKPDASNLYETIKKEVKPAAEQEPKKQLPKLAEEVGEKGTEKEVVSEPKRVRKSPFDVLLNPVVRERKEASIYLRVKPSVKKAFEQICEEKDISQSEMFSFWVESILKQ